MLPVREVGGGVGTWTAGAASSAAGVGEPASSAGAVALSRADRAEMLRDITGEWCRLPTAYSTNRPGGNRQGREDRLDLGWQVRWQDPGRFQCLVERLELAKVAAQHGDALGSLVDLGRWQFLVSRSGKASGKGVGSGPYYAYVLTGGGLRLSIMGREAFGDTPNVLVEIGAIPLMQLGTDRAYMFARSVVRFAGGSIVRESLARVDACVDLPGVAVGPFVKAVLGDQCVMRAREVATFKSGRKLTGAQIGKGDILLRVYDKWRELVTKGDAEKTHLMQELVYKGLEVHEATRVEFQLRRRALREFGVVTFEDWKGKRAEICSDYLPVKWFRIVEEVPDETHTDRYGPSDLWRRVIEAFEAWAGMGFVPVKRERSYRGDVQGLTSQLVGCLTSAAAIRGVRITGRAELREWFESLLAEFSQDRKGCGRMIQRAAEKLAVQRSRCVEVPTCSAA